MGIIKIKVRILRVTGRSHVHEGKEGVLLITLLPG